MRPILAPILNLLCLAQTALSNVEKTIFLGPAPVLIPLAQPTLENLNLSTLSPSDAQSLRTRLTAQFPTESHPGGHATWLLLDNLQEGQRYEVRICWAATQPTSFTLHTYELSIVWDTPALITSLRDYSAARQPDGSTPEPHGQGAKVEKERHASVLFLEILAAADYFTTNTTLMRHPQPVDVDIILDPFLFNVLPRSLLPTLGYIVVVAAVSFLVSQWVIIQLGHVVAPDDNSQQKKRQ